MSRRGEASGQPRRISDPGQGIVEYGLILALAVVVCVISLLFFGDQLSALLAFIASQV
jgi:Flp pilus assembly pilin Flp